ncbi:MAG: hypothetical protein ACW96M_06655 [Candidatus Thorarchaeota archaeon]|jgi:hypothetical protein
MPTHTREESFFYFSPRVKILFVLAALVTSSFLILQIMDLQSGESFPNSNNDVESRTLIVAQGDYYRMSIGSLNNEWLILKVTTNVSSYIYVRGTTDGDVKHYGTNHLIAECENWFIVTVRPYRDSQINIEWTHYDQDAEEPESNLVSISPQSVLLFLTIIVNILSIVVIFRSRFTMVYC